jgi:YihY family inner membrane protein
MHASLAKLIDKQPVLRFVIQVISGFQANQGFLLVSAVAYNTLLSIVPVFTLMLVTLSVVLDKQSLLQATRTYMALITPAQADAITDQITAFYEHWKVVGIIGFVSLVFFSSLAFSVLDNAMGVIFHHRRTETGGRHFILNALLPFIFIFLLTAGLFTLSVVTSALDALGDRSFHLLGFSWSGSAAAGPLVSGLGIVGELLLFTSIYVVMPTGRIRPSHAIVGGIVATLLWELVRQVLAWYLGNISAVNVIYGSFATVIAVLLTLEAGAFIVLLGAQVIAEYERIEHRPLLPPQ